jgi:cytochrome P450
MREEIRGYREVREAAKDFETYSSDLQGDRDVRNYRQLPLEADPPRHTAFREAVQPLFMSDAISKHTAKFEALAQKLIDNAKAKGTIEVGKDIALPYVIGCLTIIYNRPHDYDEWLAWGPDVWTADGTGKRDGATLQSYLDRVFDHAESNVNRDLDTQDVWDFVSQIEIEGKPIARTEMQGIANVLLAGGRDTVIKLITGLIWHLIGNQADREFLNENHNWFNRTIGEMVRYLSPLPKMERVPPAQHGLSDEERDPQNYVVLNFVSANYDREIWPDADRLDIHRDRKPHLAFGFGRHSCMGMNITEHEAGAFLRVILANWPSWQFARDPEIEWAQDFDKDGYPIRYIDRFNSLLVAIPD